MHGAFSRVMLSFALQATASRAPTFCPRQLRILGCIIPASQSANFSLQHSQVVCFFSIQRPRIRHNASSS